MTLTAVAVTSLPVVVSVAVPIGVVFVILLCVCGKKQKEAEPELREVRTDHAPSPEAVPQAETKPSDVNVDVDTAVTVLGTQQNGTLHSRGNSVDMKAMNRYSGASTGSSPRPATISRVLPDIPVSQSQPLQHLDFSHSRNATGTPDNHHRGGHSHLPSLPPNSRVSVPALDSHLRGGHSPLTSGSMDVNKRMNNVGAISPGSAKAGNFGLPTADSKVSDLDDYDHIDETSKKKARPRSDYDHVVLEGDKKIIIPAKSKLNPAENDYAEVRTEENIYEGVQDDDEMVIPLEASGSISPLDSRVGAIGITKVNSRDDPYNKIKGDDTPYNKIKDDPYNKIKGEDPYNRVKDDDPYNRVKDIDDLDPYDSVKDTDSSASARSGLRKKRSMNKGGIVDPYSLMEDDERNVSNQTDPYARVGDTESELEDPYNKVLEDTDSVANRSTPVPDYTDDDYATVNKGGEVEYAKVNKHRDRAANGCTASDVDSGMSASFHGNSGASGNVPLSPREEIIHDEYSTVIKIRRSSVGNTSGTESVANQAGASGVLPGATAARVTASANSQRGSYTPPEPPRGYEQETSIDADHYNTVILRQGEAESQAEGATGMTKKEPPYNKLSVRESLASMNARIASNTYEYVSDVDNLYATVDGSSGDGVVTRPKSTAADVLPAVREHYTEVDAPAPPSLDSLHETAKHHQDEVRRKADHRPGNLDYYNIKDDIPGKPDHAMGHQRTPSGQGINKTGNHHKSPSSQSHSRVQGHFRTPSSEAMSSSFEGRVTLGGDDSFDLTDQSLQGFSNGALSDDPNAEFDPNYETVEEAKSKVKYEEINGNRPNEQAIRMHIYEEADSNDVVDRDGKIRAHVYEEVTVTNEAKRTRQRVLNLHTYEEVTDVQNKGQRSSKSSGAEGVGGVEVNKKKKGHERNSSGDHWFSKRKAGDGKEKGNDGKKKNDGKDRKSGEFGKK